MSHQCLPLLNLFTRFLSGINNTSPQNIPTEVRNPQNAPNEVENLQNSVYPRASLLGLPTELRLKVYSHLAEGLHLHIYFSSVQSRECKRPVTRFCSTPDREFPQLCSRPAFSGLYVTPELCHKKRGLSNNPFALRATCRTIYIETQGILGKKKLGVTLYIDSSRAYTSLELLKLDARMHLTRLTIVYATNGSIPYSSGLHPIIAYLQHNARSFTSLCTLAIQTTQPRYKFCVKRPQRQPLFDPKNTWHKLWFVNVLREAFEARVTIVLEAWVLVRAGYKENFTKADQMVIIRGVAWGKKEQVKYGDVGFEMARKVAVADEKHAEWKKWWTLNMLGYGRRPC